MTDEVTHIVVENGFQWHTVLSPFLIAIATLFATWWATRKAHELDRNREQMRADRETCSFIRALRTELSIAWERYQEAVGEELEQTPDGEWFKGFFRARQEYLSVYRTSASKLGSIKDNDLRDAIERAYIYVTVLLEQHDMHMECNDRLEHSIQFSGTPPGPYIVESVRVHSTNALKSVRNKAEKYVADAISRIDQALAYEQ